QHLHAAEPGHFVERFGRQTAEEVGRGQLLGDGCSGGHAWSVAAGDDRSKRFALAHGRWRIGAGPCGAGAFALAQRAARGDGGHYPWGFKAGHRLMECSGSTTAARRRMGLSKTLWGYGFRPFFLAAGALAALLIPWWAGVLAWGLPLGTSWPPTLWHGHEMLFGFIAAAIAGFLLTAVPSWTGERGFAGWPLMLLAAAWVLGRLAVATASLWPLPAVAVLDLLFFPGLMILVSRPLLRARNRNTPLLAVLAALWA